MASGVASPGRWAVVDRPSLPDSLALGWTESHHACLHRRCVPRSRTQTAPERRQLHPVPLT